MRYQRTGRKYYQDLEGRCTRCARLQQFVAELENHERYPGCDICTGPLACTRPSSRSPARTSLSTPRLVYGPTDDRLNQYLADYGRAHLQTASAADILAELKEYAATCAWNNEAGQYGQLACERDIQILLAAHLRALGWQTSVEVLKGRVAGAGDFGSPG
jgi:hypothetical protein